MLFRSFLLVFLISKFHEEEVLLNVRDADTFVWFPGQGTFVCVSICMTRQFSPSSFAAFVLSPPSTMPLSSSSVRVSFFLKSSSSSAISSCFGFLGEYRSYGGAGKEGGREDQRVPQGNYKLLARSKTKPISTL